MAPRKPAQRSLKNAINIDPSRTLEQTTLDPKTRVTKGNAAQQNQAPKLRQSKVVTQLSQGIEQLTLDPTNLDPTTLVIGVTALNVFKAPSVYKRTGLLNLRKAGAFIDRITTSNSLQSPLLRMPPEIRCKIFSYVLGSYDIEIRTEHVKFIHETRTWIHRVTHKARPPGAPRGENYVFPAWWIKPTFCLPMVCRQIYHETALLVYQLNKFHFTGTARKVKGKYGNAWYNATDYWIEHRTRAQKDTLVTIEPHLRYVDEYTSNRRPAYSKTFQNLKHLIVPIHWTVKGGLWGEYIQEQVHAREKGRVAISFNYLEPEAGEI